MDEQEKHDVNEKLQEVSEKLHVERARALVLPAIVHRLVYHEEAVLGKGLGGDDDQDGVLEHKEQQHRGTLLKGGRHVLSDEHRIHSK